MIWKKAAPIVACAICTCAGAQDVEGIQNHPVQLLYLGEPCSTVIETITGPTDIPERETIEETLEETRKAMGQLAMTGMTWGALMGFEMANPGIRGTHETILMRLRDDCMTTPDATAFDLLTGYAEEVR
ncbi:hypothetical protein [uncultured Roseobacter sp.]|uniref:hypothetical protein n=1 Tax=uncultured Roseobacter sp. TaxID=114847 RepID=UPI0026312425|nr:hypothetical protein [uncultured Roseobacter sp.]